LTKMSLRIYIKGTPKFNSPKKTDSSLALSPHFNPHPSSKITHLSKKSSMIHTESREASIMSEISPIRNDNPLKNLDENNNSKTRTLSQIDSQKGSYNSRYTSYQEDEDSYKKMAKNTAHNAQNNPRMQKALKDLQRKLSNSENLPERQIRILLQDCDEIIRFLIQELEKSNKLVREKEIQNNNLLKEKDLLENDFQTMETKVYDKINQELEAKYLRESRQETDNEVELLEENDRLKKKIKNLIESNQELFHEVSELKEKVFKTENILERERESFSFLKTKVEALLTLNDELDYRLKEKEEEVKKFEANTEKLLKEMSGKNQLIEELRKSCVVSDFQPPSQNIKPKKEKDDVNNIVNSLAEGNHNHTYSWSTFRMESPRELLTDKAREEANEWKKKYEASKNDNLRLMKMIEGNQKIIKDLKDSFSELEKRNSVRF